MRRFYMLDINLTEETAERVDCTELFSEWLGGTGVATKLLYDSCSSETDPLNPEAPVIFAIGPLNNMFPVMSKTVALFKSPLTGDLGESHAGGRLGLALFESGNHVIRIRGKAKEFSYLSIENDQIELKQAYSLKGMSALATERVLRDVETRSGKRSFLRIGPAGERLSPIACVTVDASRHFGRLGLGAVLGSKNVKAIVVSGDRYFKLDNKKPYLQLYQRIFDQVVNSEAMTKYHDLGTSMNVIPLSKINGLPTRNFSQGFFEGAENISGETFARDFLAQQIACAGCPIGCIHMATYREAFEPEHHMYKTLKVSYDHELIYALGSNLSIDSPEMVLKLLQVIEKQGWDAISMGVTLAWATEAFQKGVIDEKVTGGEILSFGDGETYLRVLQRISNRSSEFFSDLEKGTEYCSKKYGGEGFAMAFRRNEAPGYMTGINAFLGYATGVRHSHLDSAGYSVDQEIINNPVSLEEQVRKIYDEACWRFIFNSLVGCLFARKIYDRRVVLEALDVSGIKEWTEDSLSLLSRKIHALKFKFKEENGFSFDDLSLPRKLEHVYTTNGKLSRDDFKEGIELYTKWLREDYHLV